ncbi:MAG: response regulator [bacterium]|nr:response regulator [bacterium]
MPSKPSPAHPEPPLILVVDEEEEDRTVLCEQIRQAGYRLLEATSAQDALEQLKSEPVNLVVTDLLMSDSDFSGWDLLDAVKKSYPRVRVVVMTNNMTDHGEAILVDRKASGYLIKPVIPERMRILFSALLSPQNLGRPAEVVAFVPDTDTSKLIEKTLNARGLHVVSFPIMHQAMRYIKNDPPDLILVSLIPSQEIGFDFCRAIRFTPGIAYTPILALVSGPSREMVTRAVRLRVNGILAKPFNPEELAKRTLHLLRQANTARKKKA